MFASLDDSLELNDCGLRWKIRVKDNVNDYVYVVSIIFFGFDSCSLTRSLEFHESGEEEWFAEFDREAGILAVDSTKLNSMDVLGRCIVIATAILTKVSAFKIHGIVTEPSVPR